MVAVCVFIVVVNIYEYFFPEPNPGYCAVGCATVSCAETFSDDSKCPFNFFVIVCAAVLVEHEIHGKHCPKHPSNVASTDLYYR